MFGHRRELALTQVKPHGTPSNVYVLTWVIAPASRLLNDSHSCSRIDGMNRCRPPFLIDVHACWSLPSRLRGVESP